MRFTVRGPNWNLKMLFLYEWGKWSTWRNTSRSKDKNQQLTQPTYPSKLVGGGCSLTTAASLFPAQIAFEIVTM